MSANVLHLKLEALLRAPLGTLERQMLQKMRDAVVVLLLVGSTSVNKHTHAACLRGRLLSGDREAVLELGDLSVG